MSKKLISISVPLFNEEGNVTHLLARLRTTAEANSRYDFEFVLTDNASTDSTWLIICEEASSDSRIRAQRFGSNVGVQKSLLANYGITKGAAVMQLDADLQDPPELISEFLKFWEDGFQDVYGIREERAEGWAINSFRRLGYWFINAVAEKQVTRDVGDFRLLDRAVIDALLRLKSPHPYIRGMLANLGFRQIGIPYSRSPRTQGESKFGVWRILKLGLQGILNHSTLPLRLASYIGLLVLFTSIFGALGLGLQKLVNPGVPVGWTSLAVLILFGIGLISSLLGVIGEYILRIYVILRNDPLVTVVDSIN